MSSAGGSAEPAVIGSASVSHDDGQVRVFLAGRLEQEQFDNLATYLRLHWKRSEQCLVGPWSPRVEDILREIYGVELVVDNVDLRAVAARRAEHYQDWAEDAATRFEEEAEAGRAILDRIPMGQPVLVGHHSEGRHRRDLARADGHARRSYEQMQRRDHWTGRAEDTTRHAERRYTTEQLYARVGMLEVARRRHEREAMAALEKGSGRAALDAARWHNRHIEFIDRRLELARHALVLAENEAGDNVEDSVAARLALQVEVGGAVSEDGLSGETPIWFEVVRVNKKTLTVRGWPHVPQMTHKFKREKVKQVLSPAEWKSAEKAVYGPGMRIIGGVKE